MDCGKDCKQEFRIRQLEKDFQRFDSKSSGDHKEFYNRIEKVEKDFSKFESDMEHIKETTERTEGKVDVMMQKPSDRYETLVKCVMTAVVAAVIGYAMSGVFPV